MKRIDVESKLNESRNLLLANFEKLTPEQLRRPITQSEHDPRNHWNALDHFSHLALIETTFAAMIRRHVSGHEDPVGLLTSADGTPRSREEIFTIVHASNEEFQRAHHDEELTQIIALTGVARGESLKLLGELTDQQLDEILEGAPWADGTLGGVIGANADHAGMHWKWLKEAGLLHDPE